VPWLLGGADLGNRVLEVGAGPGIGTEKLLEHAEVVAALEPDAGYLRSLRARSRHSSIAVIAGDATELPFKPQVFSSVVAIMMLHHVWPADAQERVVTEAFRVLRPGGVFIGIDAKPEGFKSRIVHCGDHVLPIDIQYLLAKFEAAGFQHLDIRERGAKFRFRAVRPLR